MQLQSLRVLNTSRGHQNWDAYLTSERSTVQCCSLGNGAYRRKVREAVEQALLKIKLRKTKLQSPSNKKDSNSH